MAASWRPLGALGELLGSLGGLLGSFWRPLEPLGELLEPLGCLLGVSWDLFAGLEVEKWPWLEREHDF